MTNWRQRALQSVHIDISVPGPHIHDVVQSFVLDLANIRSVI